MRFSLLVLLASMLLLRAFSLEIPNLVEPTEGRYAAMAHHMVESDNWAYPQFPIGNSYEPYLGKPPLFFWLTALSYKSLGVDEWSGRLPSFLCYALIALCLFGTGILLKREKIFGIAAFLWASSLIPFFFSGAIVLDICLTATVTIALLASMLLNHLPKKKVFLYIFWLSLALGVLCKGPVAFILIWAPIILYGALQRSISLLKNLLQLEGFIVFCIFVIPWFLLAEIRNPGFCYYFFIHENFLRFFIKDYGDLYGSGHRYPHGMAFLFFLFAFFPWSTLILSNLRKGSIQNLDPTLYLPGIACLFTILFFCAMKQLHIGYVIPAIPWAALLVAHWHSESKRIIPVSVATSLGFSAALVIATPYIDVAYSSTRITACIAKNRASSDEPVAVLSNKSFGARLLRTDWEAELSHPLPLSFVSTLDLEKRLPHDLMVLKDDQKEVNLSQYFMIASLGPWEWWSVAKDMGIVECSPDDEL